MANVLWNGLIILMLGFFIFFSVIYTVLMGVLKERISMRNIQQGF